MTVEAISKTFLATTATEKKKARNVGPLHYAKFYVAGVAFFASFARNYPVQSIF